MTRVGWLALPALIFAAFLLPATADAAPAQQAYVKASNTQANDGFAQAVAISGNTMVVGAPFEDSNGAQNDNSFVESGAAYVFTRSGAGGTWTQQAYLKSSNTDPADHFGQSVAISGDTIVVGAAGEDSNATGAVGGDQADNSAAQSGAAYVFTRTGSTWSQEAYLKASNTGSLDGFGQSVAVDGDTIVVGADDEDSNANTINGNQGDNSLGSSGAAYVFIRSSGIWSQQAYLKAFNTGGGDEFGFSAAISGDTIVIGARSEDSSNGNPTDNLRAQSGAAYVFIRSAGSWSQQAYLKASNIGLGDNFGWTVGVSGDTIVIGSPFEEGSSTGVDGAQNDILAGAGAAYVFTRSTGIWTQQAYMKASNTDANDVFAQAVAISGDTIVIGAPAEDSLATGVDGDQGGFEGSAGTDPGAAYLFTRSGTTWSQQAYLKASNTGAQDRFAQFVAISGDTMVIGAIGEDSNATGVNGDQSDNSFGDSGAAYVFAPSLPPSITSAASTTFTVGTAGTFTVTTSGNPPGVALTETGALPANVTFTDNGDGTATLAGTPDPGTGGNYSVMIKASNGVAPDALLSFTLTVNEGMRITSADHTTFTEGTPGTFTVTTAGSPAHASSMSRTGPLPAGVHDDFTANSTITISGTPAAGSSGVYPLTFKASNGVGSEATQSFTLTVNGPPSFTSANNATFAVGSAGTFTVTTSGFPNSTLSRTGALPSSVNFTDNGDGTATLAGTPAAGTGGTYPLSIKASNGVGPDATQPFTLTVNEAPAITTDPASQTASVGDTVSFDAAASGFPGPTVRWQRSTDGGGSFTDIPGATSATYSFTAAAGQNDDRYRAVATNSVDSDTSQAAVLTLTPRVLTVATAGNGAGTVSGVGIDCGAPGRADCTETIPDGSSVTLTVHPAANSVFAGFTGGGCTGTGTNCTVSMNAAKSVTATFILKRHSLAVTHSGSGSGSVSSSPAGIDCPSACGAQFDEGAVVRLTAHPDPGSEFAGFTGGGCSGSDATCTVPIGSGATTVDAQFTATIPAPPNVPETTIGHHPKNPKHAHTHFRFRSSIGGSTFTCTLDGSAAEACRSPQDYRDLKPGRHVFTVAATAPNGQTDPTPAKARFRISG